MSLLAIGEVIGAVGKVASDLVTTDKERLALELQAKELDQRLDLAQIDLNKAEASSGSLFNAGWRPAIGWVGAIALFMYYVPYILAATVLWAWQVIQTGTLVERPDLGIADLLGLVFSMLGMSTLRTVEKFRGVATK